MKYALHFMGQAFNGACGINQEKKYLFRAKKSPMEILVPLLAGLSPPGFYLFKNGITLEIKPCRKSA